MLLTVETLADCTVLMACADVVHAEAQSGHWHHDRSGCGDQQPPVPSAEAAVPIARRLSRACAPERVCMVHAPSRFAWERVSGCSGVLDLTPTCELQLRLLLPSFRSQRACDHYRRDGALARLWTSGPESCVARHWLLPAGRWMAHSPDRGATPFLPSPPSHGGIGLGR